MKAGDPARIQLIYERALAENCLVPDLWARYNQYLVRQTEMFGVLFFIFICLFILISQWLINNSECFPNPVTLPLNFREAEISFHLFSVVYLLIKRAFAQFFPQLCIFSAEFVLGSLAHRYLKLGVLISGPAAESERIGLVCSRPCC